MFEIQTSKREHKGYKYIWNYVNDIVERFNVPITKIKISNSDGNWNMHGKLMHSGYHFLDLLAYFMEINTKNGFIENRQKIHVSDYRLNDFYAYFGKEFNKKLGFEYKEEVYENLDVIKNFGELELTSIIEYLDSNDNIITTAVLDLSQNAFCGQSWLESPENTYKGNGMIRHEIFDITVGPLLNIKMFSLELSEIKIETESTKDICESEHFEIHIFNNSNITGNKPFETITLNDINKKVLREATKNSYTQNEESIYSVLDDFLYKGISNSNILAH